MVKTISLAAIVTLTCAPLAAQWIKQPTSGIPRRADGTPDLSAAVPRTPDRKPDLSGLWWFDSRPYGVNVAADLQPGDTQPWAEALYKSRLEALGKDDPGCHLPLGPRLFITGGGMAKIVQTPSVVALFYEVLSPRQILMDGRELPHDPNPTFMGYSVGRWEGETLVVESSGFNDRTWLDAGGHPHTEALRLTERFRRRDFGHMDLHVTLDDPKAYAKPWTLAIKMTLAADTELIEYVCENEKDYVHLVGKASDDTRNAVKVAPDVLSRYVGAYGFQSSTSATIIRRLDVELSGDELFLNTYGLLRDLGGKERFTLNPLSETTFVGGGVRVSFEKDDQGVVTHFLLLGPEGPELIVRALPHPR